MMLETIEQQFFFPGHSRNDCDRCFEMKNNCLEASNSTSDLFTPKDWIELISSSKQKNPKFDLSNMTSTDFYSVQH